MKRRDFMRAVGAIAGLGMTAIPARAQGQIRRIGVLAVEGPAPQLLEETLKQRGWTLGQNLQIEYRIYNGDTDLAHRYARELISLKPDVLYAVTNTSMAALQLEGSTIPTVFAMVSDPVQRHYVDSFSRPGRNVTGFTPFVPSLGAKWVSILKEVAPDIRRIGLIYNPEPGNNAASFRKSIDETAGTTGVVSVEAPSGGSSDIERLILSLKEKPHTGLIFLPDAFTWVHRAHLTALIGQCRLPAIYPLRGFVDAGGLISYGSDIKKIFVAAASYIDRILRGANSAELPVQVPTEFELVVNQKAATQLRLQLSPTLLARADEVIE
ncbi:ABC transporter substrate-binding protein [Bradyrhizobium guangdongense]|uniref:ABC transporter substrate-binding protein n=1 Tax=Bradyrhizobium guangdongense TaxID=1325090 RepID=UPI00112759C4|nr:ABC transporter substrate-binding protein [Bradyrhizobium guangdongense]TPQ31707.1 ABC transporter substrate-binding protein [Bradyrhizobium guangdongense]